MAKTKAPAHTRPVRLQINNSGSWKNLTHFDASDERVNAKVMRAAETLGGLDSHTVKFRIVTTDIYPIVLIAWEKACGWKEVTSATDSDFLGAPNEV